MKVRFYGPLAETIGPEIEVRMAVGCTLAELRHLLVAHHPNAEQPLRSRRALACVRHSVVQDDYILEADDEVEFLPPVSGG